MFNHQWNLLRLKILFVYLRHCITDHMLVRIPVSSVLFDYLIRQVGYLSCRLMSGFERK